MGSEQKRYKYPLCGVLLSTVPPSVVVLFGLVLLLRWVETLLVALSGLLRGYQPRGEDLKYLGVAWIPLIIGCTLLTFYTEVIVAEAGMKVRVLIFKWVFIPWEDVLAITVTPIPGGNDPNLWRFIRVKRLTLFHRLLSICYLTGLQPVLIIGKQMEGYEELIQIIEEHVAKRRSAAQGEAGP